MILTIVLSITAMIGCRTRFYDEDNTRIRSIRLSSSTTYKYLQWAKTCQDNKVIAKSLIIGRSACFSQKVFYSKEKSYHANGKLQQVSVYKGARTREKTFYSNGKLKSKSVEYVKSNIIDSIDVRQVLYTKTLLVDSATRKTTLTEKLDTVSLIKAKF